TSIRSKIDARTLGQHGKDRVNKLRRFHRGRIFTFELRPIDKRIRERHPRRFKLGLLIRYQRMISLKLVITRQAPESGSIKPVEKHARIRQLILDEQIRRDLYAARTQTIVARTARIELRSQSIDRGLIGFATGEIRILLRDKEAKVIEWIGTVRSDGRVDRYRTGYVSSFTGVGLQSQRVIAKRRVGRHLQLDTHHRKRRCNLFAS